MFSKLRMSTRSSTGTVVSEKWVNFHFWVEYPFKAEMGFVPLGSQDFLPLFTLCTTGRQIV